MSTGENGAEPAPLATPPGRRRKTTTPARAREPHEAPAKKASDLFTPEQIEEFLNATRRGIGRHLAAEGIGSTGSQMRALCRPERDPEFAVAYEAALEEGAEYYRERLQAQARTMATGKDANPRILEVELGTHVPAYAHLRRDRVKHEGVVLHEHSLVIDLSKLDELPVEELEEVRGALARLQPVIEGSGQQRELAP